MTAASATSAAATLDARVAQTRIFMGTTVSIEVWRATDPDAARAAISRAFNWFRLVEATCSRFNPDSELYRLCRSGAQPFEVSPLLFNAIEFALHVAEETGGAFDPTVGDAMVRAGFRTHHTSGREVAPLGARPVSYRDIELDRATHKVRLAARLTLDLGAVAKGMAIDLASEELSAYPDHAIDAGGDLIVRGFAAGRQPWSIGIRDPRDPDRTCCDLRLSDVAVCTSGGYLRRRPDGQPGHHLIDPATGSTADRLASATVVAPSAMVADALATAAFVLGPERALPLLQRQGVDGLLLGANLERHMTAGMSRWLA